MRAGGLIRQRRYKGKTYSLVFIGSEMLTWCVKSGISPDRRTAATLGNLLLKTGLIYHVLEGKGFIDGFQVYRFRCDDTTLRNRTKQGWLSKRGRWRNKLRYYVYDRELKQLSEYKTHEDDVPIYSYPLTHETVITQLEDDPLGFHIALTNPDHEFVLWGDAISDVKSWVRTLKNVGVENSESPRSPVEREESSESARQYQIFIFHMASIRFSWSSMFGEFQNWKRDLFEPFRLLCIRKSKSSDSIRERFSELLDQYDNPLGKLITKFCKFFLQPFYKTKMKSLECESIDRIISHAVDDLQSFLTHTHSILHHLLEHPKIKEEVFEICNQCIVRKVFATEVYEALFNLYKALHREDDLQLTRRLKQLVHYRPRDFGVSRPFWLEPGEVDNQDSISRTNSIPISPSNLIITDDLDPSFSIAPYQKAINCFRRMISCRSPVDKLEAIVATKECVVDCILDYNASRGIDNTDLIDANDMICLFAYLLTKLSSRHIQAQLAFMSDFLNNDSGNSGSAYYLSTLKVSITAILRDDFALESQNDV